MHGTVVGNQFVILATHHNFIVSVGTSLEVVYGGMIGEEPIPQLVAEKRKARLALKQVTNK